MIYERIIELIVLLLEELQHNKQLLQSDVEKLTNLGYTQNEINTAFSWIYSKYYQGDKIFLEKSNSKHFHRFLHEVEKNVITSESYGYIIQLRELGLLNDYDIELIIDKIMVSTFHKINLADMKMFIASYLLDVDEMNSTNKRISLNTNDTLN